MYYNITIINTNINNSLTKIISNILLYTSITLIFLPATNIYIFKSHTIDIIYIIQA